MHGHLYDDKPSFQLQDGGGLGRWGLVMGTARTCGWGPTLPVRPPFCAASCLPQHHHHHRHHLRCTPLPARVTTGPFLGPCHLLPLFYSGSQTTAKGITLCLLPAPPAIPMQPGSAPFQFQIPPPQPHPCNVESSFHHMQQALRMFQRHPG